MPHTEAELDVKLRYSGNESCGVTGVFGAGGIDSIFLEQSSISHLQIPQIPLTNIRLHVCETSVR